jgi:hypothetical protein
MLSIYFILFSLISILTSSYGQVTCATGWAAYGGSCLKFNPAFNSDSTTGTWDQCNAYCNASYPGATMLCVNNEAENDWMWSQYGGENGWIGYTDMPPYGGGKGTMQYGWVTGCSSTYTNWYPGEPNNSGNNEDYAYMRRDDKWNVEAPQDSHRCGCQYKLSTVFSSTDPTAGPTSSPTATVGSVSE